MTLYRKYRPRKFSDVVGQEYITGTLAREILNDKIGHAYLFCGTRGTGKTSVAKIFAQAVNCENLQKNGDPCLKCEACKSIVSGMNADVSEIDAASNNGVDHVRSLRDEVLFAPATVKYRVYIIDEVHMMTPAAFNALLKTLEEPPKHAIFILATTEAHKVPMTIQSRCQRFDFSRISSEEIKKQLLKVSKLDEFVLDEDAAELIASVADGAMRDALSGLEQCKSAGNVTKEVVQEVLKLASVDKVLKLISAMSDKKTENALKIAKELDGGDATVLFNAIFTQATNIAVVKFGAGETLETTSEIMKELTKLSREIEVNFIVNLMQKCSEMIGLSRYSGLTMQLLYSLIIETSV